MDRDQTNQMTGKMKYRAKKKRPTILQDWWKQEGGKMDYGERKKKSKETNRSIRVRQEEKMIASKTGRGRLKKKKKDNRLVDVRIGK